MATKAIFVEKVKAKLEAWKADVEHLQANAERIDSQSIRTYTATIQEILAKIQQIEKQFTQIERLHAGTWQELKRRVDTSFAELGPLVEKAKKKYLS